MPREPKRMPHPKGRMGNFEKPKNFSEAIKRLTEELIDYKKLIIIACVLAMLSSILSIIAPNRLSSLTDEISKGLKINENNLKAIATTISKSSSHESLEKKVSKILEIDKSNNTYDKIMQSDLSPEDKEKSKEAVSSDSVSKLSELPESALNIILTDSTYKDIKVTKSDKMTLIKSTKGQSELRDNMIEILFDDLNIDSYTITKKDQYEFVKSMNNQKYSNPKAMYKQIEKLPKTIKNAVIPKMNMSKIKAIALLLIILYLSSGIFNYIQSVIMSTISNKFAQKLRTKIENKIGKLPLKYFDSHLSGDILSRVTNDVDTIAQTMNQSLSSLVSSITLFLGSLLMMFVTNYIMAITAILSSMIGFLGMSIILKKSQKYFKQRQTELGNLNGHIEEIYSGLNVVKAYNGNTEANKKFNEYNTKVCESNKKSQFISGLMQPLMGFIGNFGYVMVCIVGAILTMNGSITFGVIVAFMIYIKLFTQPLSQVAQALTSMQSAAAASERVFEFTDEEEMSDDSNVKIHLKKEKVKGHITFENVTFKYDGNESPTIKNFSAEAKPGQKIAIVGPTGAGKTTMVNLLMKFYDIDSGDIKIDGISTKELSKKNIHELFTMVLQDTWLFDGTIKENIVFNRKGVTNTQIDEVCKKVGIDHFIKTLSHGYDTKITDNDTISAGQRQLLTIARSMIENSPFLILDEATSNVDTRTEELVQKAMDELAKGKTSFIIAHRLSTIKNADLILVMKDGNIVEKGNHKQLIEKGGFYKNLYNAQFEE